MDLISKAPNGRLDSLAACRLLWCGALSLSASDVTWDGTTHHARTVTIHDDVISLYGLPRAEAEAALPDLLDLLDALAQDEQLRVPGEQVAAGVRNALLFEQLTGLSLFALQCGAHPLIVESAGKDTARVRYDARLARGIPHLQELLCRMLCHLQVFRGETRPFVVEFAENSAARANGHDATPQLQDVDGCVDGARARLDARVSVVNELAEAREDAEAHKDAAAARGQDAGEDHGLFDKRPAQDTNERQRLATTLESEARVTRALVATMKQQVQHLEEAHAQAEQTGPDPHAKARLDHSPTKGGLPGSAQATRSLVVRSALYIGIGIALMWLGRCCIVDGKAISAQLAAMCSRAISLASDYMNIMLVNTSSLGSGARGAIAPDAFVGVLRVVGLVLLGLAIVVPVRKILKHRRRLSRELSFNASHASFMAELAEKQRLGAEAEYSQALDAWATHLQQLEEDVRLARDTLARLEQTDERAQEAMAALGIEPANPSDAPAFSRAENDVLKGIRGAHSEQQRCQRVADHCDRVDKTVELVTQAL